MMLVLFAAAINRLRGWESGYEKFHSKYVCALCLGAAAGIYALDAVVSSIVAAGWALWAWRGWGDYFDFSARTNHEIRVIDAVVSYRIGSGAVNDMLSMSLRGLFILPLFVALSIYLSEPFASLLGLAACLQGPFYYVGHRLWPDVSGRAVIFGEVTTGALHGAMLWGVLA